MPSLMELGLQKRRSSWCDEEDLVWHPWRRWGGRWSWSFLQIADFLPGLSIAIIVVISKMLTMMMTMLMMISALISSLMAMAQVCIAMIYILIWVSRTFISLHLLSTGHSTAIIRCYWNFVLMFIREYFRLIDGNDPGVQRLWRSPVQRSCDPWLWRQRISIHGRGH